MPFSRGKLYPALPHNNADVSDSSILERYYPEGPSSKLDLNKRIVCILVFRNTTTVAPWLYRISHWHYAMTALVVAIVVAVPVSLITGWL